MARQAARRARHRCAPCSAWPGTCAAAAASAKKKNQLDEATYTQRPDGKYDVRLTLRAAKMRADSLGNETPIALADYVDIGIFGPDQAKKTEDYDASGRPLFF